MLLAEAATIAEKLRNLYRNYMTDAEERSKYFRQIVDIIREGVHNSVDDSSDSQAGSQSHVEDKGRRLLQNCQQNE